MLQISRNSKASKSVPVTILRPKCYDKSVHVLADKS